MAAPEVMLQLLERHRRLASALGDLWVEVREAASGLMVAGLRQRVDDLAALIEQQAADERRVLGLARRRGDKEAGTDFLAAHADDVTNLLAEARELADERSLAGQEGARHLLDVLHRLFFLVRREERELIWELSGRPSYVTDGIAG